jgi:hypothetical protein
MAKEAATKALADAKIPYSEVQQAVVGYVYGKIRIFYFLYLFIYKYVN